jgi:Holliday junction resolvasome RuvABC endonuclease subunit
VKVVGLDLSLSAPALALVQPPDAPVGWVMGGPKIGSLRGAHRLARIAEDVGDAVKEFRPDIVAIEGYSFGSVQQAHHIGELGGVVRYVLHVAGIQYEEIPPGRWRKQLFGRNVAKDEVRHEAFKRYGIEFESLDVLEAWCVATALYRLREGIDRPAPVRRVRRVTSAAVAVS